MLILMVYRKLSRLSQYGAKMQEIGKVINLMSSDFSTIEANATIFFAALSAPFGIIGIIAILVYRFGWPGILIAVVIAIVFPIQIAIGKLNSMTIKKANVYKDKRVKASTEFV